MRVTIVGAGRAGSAFAIALDRAGYDVTLVHHDEVAALETDGLVMLCVPDDAIADVSDSLAPSTDRVVVHVAGSRGLGELSRHPRAGFMHPLAILSSGPLGAERLRGALYSVGGDDVVLDVVAALHGRALRVRDDQRAAYHAAAAVAANHVVVLLAHLESIAESAGLGLGDFAPLIEQALGDVLEVGAHRALTGPASRGDLTTIDAHLAAIPEGERATYVALARAALDLAEQRRLASA